ncbi:MAG: PorT family protein [Hymenobacteraceae bacterium]|nr:PorT family protein [Hymenobacteraceae bacterium]MDX5396453.1 PorT family protein [Hymenobacteraceae bacterium]MDX5442565.1 PorT family protein [Hymenobacteraceae bacterium]MDX5512514.1 PorT family protein [Hymenobacteraceae bacterium]
MKKVFVCLLVWLLSVNCFAQDGPFSVGFIGSLDFYSFDLKPQEVHDLETPFNYSLGLQGCYMFTDNICGNMSIIGSRKSYRLMYNYERLGRAGLPEDPRMTEINAYYLEVPIAMEYYYVNNPKLKLFAAAGIVPALLVDDNEQTTSLDEIETNTNFLNTDLSDFIFGASISTGLKYKVHDSKSIRIEPFYRPYFGKVDKNFMQSNTSLFGITIGVFQHF